MAAPERHRRRHAVLADVLDLHAEDAALADVHGVAVVAGLDLAARPASALSIGIANAVVLPDWPKKSSLCAAAVFMPMTLPSVSTSGPPESPGSIGAEIWIMPCSVSELPVPCVARGDLLVERGDRAGRRGGRAAAAAGVADRDDGVADRDVRRVGEAHGLEARHVVDLEERDVVDDVVAEHLRGVALAGVDDLRRGCVVAPSITWLLVSTSPDDEMIMPVPAASPCCRRS